MGPHESLPSLLSVEHEFFEEHFEEHARLHPGQYLLICGRELVGAYPSREEALREGYRRGVKKMLVQKSGTRDEPMFVPTILSA